MAGPRLDEACGAAMAEPQADDVARQGRAVARDDDAARAASLNHDGAPSGGPSDRECLALGSAESFAQTLLLQDQTVTAQSILEVFELLPEQELPRGSALEGAKAFSIGAYSHGGIVGVRESTKLFPHVARFFCKAISVVSPSHLFSTITLHRQVHVSCHQDSQNYGVPNLVVPLTFFEGGQIFVHDAQGPDWHCGAPGHLLDVQLRPWVFNAKRYKHEVLPHSGVRATMVAYSVGRLHLLCDRDRCLLESLGFKVPTSEVEDLPTATSEGLCDLRRHDPDLQDPNPSPLPPKRPDPRALPMIHAPLPDAGPLIIELFAGVGTSTAFVPKFTLLTFRRLRLGVSWSGFWITERRLLCMPPRQVQSAQRLFFSVFAVFLAGVRIDRFIGSWRPRLHRTYGPRSFLSRCVLQRTARTATSVLSIP